MDRQPNSEFYKYSLEPTQKGHIQKLEEFKIPREFEGSLRRSLAINKDSDKTQKTTLSLVISTATIEDKGLKHDTLFNEKYLKEGFRDNEIKVFPTFKHVASAVTKDFNLPAIISQKSLGFQKLSNEKKQLYESYFQKSKEASTLHAIVQ